MFKKNLYSFCAVLALSSSAYAVLGEDDELASGRSALRASQGASASSPASSTQSSLFSDEGNVIFTWPALQQAASYENPNPDPRAQALLSFLQEMYGRYQVAWDSEVVYELPLLPGQLDGIWDLAQDQELVRKIGKAIGAYPTTEKAVGKLSKALDLSSQGSSSSKEGKRKLKELAVRVADELGASRKKLSTTEGEYTALRAIRLQELIAKEEAERQLAVKTAQLAARETELESSRAQTAAKAGEAEELTARLASLEAAFEAFKVETDSLVGCLRTSLEKERAQNQLFQNSFAVISKNVAALAKLNSSE